MAELCRSKAEFEKNADTGLQQRMRDIMALGMMVVVGWRGNFSLLHVYAAGTTVPTWHCPSCAWGCPAEYVPTGEMGHQMQRQLIEAIFGVALLMQLMQSYALAESDAEIYVCFGGGSPCSIAISTCEPSDAWEYDSVTVTGCLTASQAQARNAADTVCDWTSQYIITPATATSFGECSVLTTCTLGTSYQTTAPTYTTDRICSSVRTCVQGVSYQTTAPTLVSDRICSLVTACDVGSTYQSVAPTLTSDMQCENVTNCTLGHTWQSAAPSATANRVCSCVWECTLGVGYQATAPTLTSDRVCKRVTQCIVGVNYQSALPTLTSDRRCENVVTNCTLGQTWQSMAPTASTNRVCSPVTPCILNFT